MDYLDNLTIFFVAMTSVASREFWINTNKNMSFLLCLWFKWICFLLKNRTYFGFFVKKIGKMENNL